MNNNVSARTSASSRTIIKRVWLETLCIETVNSEDNFFKLGGTSLQAMQMLWAVCDELNIEVLPTDIFTELTINKMVEYLNEDADDLKTILKPYPRKGSIFPLSYAQQRLWFIDQVEGLNSHYNEPMAFQLHGDVDLSRLENSLIQIIERHEPLRTRFIEKEGTASQQIATNFNFTLGYEQIETEGDLQTLLAKCISNEVYIPFDLSQDVLLRAKVFEYAENLLLLVITQHHIAMDGWSVGVLISDLNKLYANQALKSLPVQYADFTKWQRDLFATGFLDNSLAYWQLQLDDLPLVHSLPLDHERGIERSYRGKVHRQPLAKKLVEELSKLCEAEETTLFVVFQVTLAILMARYSGEDDIVMGTPISGRTQPEVVDMIGFFVNTLVLRSDFSSNLDFIEQLRQARTVFLDALKNQHVPFEMLVEILAPSRRLQVNPLFQVLFAMQNNEKSLLSMSDVVVEQVDIQFEKAKFDLSLHVYGEGHDLSLMWEFNTDLFEQDSIEKLSSHYIKLLGSALNDIHCPVKSLPMLLEQDKQLLRLLGKSEPGIEIPEETLHQLFEAQVTSRPDTLAVQFGDSGLTYAQLNQRADQLAQYLINNHDLSCGRIGLYFERSIDLVVAMLAVLKTGCAYVAIDPRYPQKRINFILEDTAITTLLSHADLSSLDSNQCQIVNIDELSLTFVDTLIGAHQCNDIAYVVYTSGSTGTPKGIEMGHQVLCRLFSWLKQEYSLLAQPLRVLQYSSIAFDMCCADIFMTFAAGGCLKLIDQEQLLNIQHLQNELQENKINWINLPYAVLQVLCTQANAENRIFPELKSVVSTAEQLLVTPDIRVFFERHMHTQLINMYGPAETHVVTCHQLSGEPQFWPDFPAIGMPVADVSLHVLDDNCQLVPPGVNGELYIEGALAKGYLNLDSLNQQKFVHLPIFEGKTVRLYRTGDIVRWRTNGHLQYLGRRDNQVKIRGFRIELGEIESHLLQHPQVKEAYVKVMGEFSADRYIVAYVSTSNKHIKQDLIKRLSLELPDYMLPKAIVTMVRLPINANGKVNHRLLPEVDFNQLEEGLRLPETPTEASLLSIWQDILQLDNISTDANFFSLGGHSLLLTKLLSVIETQFGTNLGIKSLFENTSIVEQSQLIDTTDLERSLEIVVRAETDNTFLSYEQKRMWFINRFEGDSANYNISVVTRLKGSLCRSSLNRSFETIIQRHQILRTVYQSTGTADEVQQKLLSGTSFSLNFSDFSANSDAEKKQQIEQYTQRSIKHEFNISADLMLKVDLLKQTDDCHLLIINMHHIATDGWSIAIMFKELNQLYNAFAKGQPTPLPPLSLQYSDYSYFQRQWLQGELLQSQMNYWQSKLQNLPFEHQLPLDFERPEKHNYNGRVYNSVLDADLTEKLNVLANQQNATLFMVLQAAFCIFLNRWSHEEDIVFGTPVAGRTRSEFGSLIGLFVNSLVLRHDLSGDPSFIDFLAHTKQVAVEAYDNQHLPFEMLVEKLSPQRSSNITPLFQIMMALHNNEQVPLAFDNIEAEDVPTTYQVAKFDLTLHIVESNGQLRLSWEYNRNLFSSLTVSRFTQHFNILLKNIVAQPQNKIHKLPMLTLEETQSVANWFEVTPLADKQPLTIEQLFEIQVTKFPNEIALCLQQQTLSYDQVNRKANQLARYLLDTGLKSGEPVGLCVKRSFDMIIGMLGILKAGGVYVPIDTNYPQERIDYIVNDTQLKKMLTQQHIHPFDIEVINLDESSLIERLATNNDDNLSTAEMPAREKPLAYIMYTSGSTGQPKGVMIRHDGVLRLVNQPSYVSLNRDSRILQSANVSFDAATFEIWGALLNGGQLILYPEQHISAPVITEVIEQYRVNTIWLTAALFEVWTDQLKAVPECLLHVLTGGDVVSADAVERLYELSTNLLVSNCYGPTENTTFTSSYEIPRSFGKNNLPIGYSINNTGVIVVNRSGTPVPIGAAGELLVSGVGLAVGYFNSNEQTAQKFVYQSLSDGQDIRVYKTGDIVKQQLDGLLHFKGRIDSQVKIRGFRVELQEIAVNITDTMFVRDAVVMVREDNLGEKQLVAYLVLAQKVEQRNFVEELRDELKLRLPEYMIPIAYVVVFSLPITANGKYDTAQLPKPMPEHYPTNVFVPPVSNIEIELSSIWQDTLNINKIGITSDFFELGGHSLLATRLISAISEQTGYRVSLNDIFGLRTIRRIALKIEQQMLQTQNERSFNAMDEHESEEIQW